eukprot:TRINITY_DN10759_c0_g1_i3.p1 TRINITY_DN10759_c0_g1~~TRINITY_DN10759_c0_g1_i3.p1  ORF type:complete len:124 (-),score=6.59 TRINITY_DN10759_c0_g1_i3:36-407(-)
MFREEEEMTSHIDGPPISIPIGNAKHAAGSMGCTQIVSVDRHKSLQYLDELDVAELWNQKPRKEGESMEIRKLRNKSLYNSPSIEKDGKSLMMHQCVNAFCLGLNRIRSRDRCQSENMTKKEI